MVKNYYYFYKILIFKYLELIVIIVIRMKKLLVIGILFIIVGMIFSPAISASSADESEEESDAGKVNQPLLIVEIISSGYYGFIIKITNIGDEAATNIQTTISLSGMIFIGKEISAPPRDRLEPGESMTVDAIFGLIFGIGPVEIIVTVTYDGMIEPAVDSAEGFMLGPLILGLH